LETGITDPPRQRIGSTRIIEQWLDWRRATCLERSLIIQRSLWAAGRRHDLLIGVVRADGKITAHAWLDHEPDLGYIELLRIEPAAASLPISAGILAALNHESREHGHHGTPPSPASTSDGVLDADRDSDNVSAKPDS
jgi:hypothetical protein